MVDQNNRNKTVGEMHNIEGWTKWVFALVISIRNPEARFTFPGRGEEYSKLKWNFNHFTGVDYDAKTETNAIYKVGRRRKMYLTADSRRRQGLGR